MARERAPESTYLGAGPDRESESGAGNAEWMAIPEWLAAGYPEEMKSEKRTRYTMAVHLYLFACLYLSVQKDDFQQ